MSDYSHSDYDKRSDYYQSGDNYHPYNSDPKDKYAGRALIFAILAAFGMVFLLPGVIFGILAAVFGVASRIDSGRWCASSIIGLVIGCLSVLGTFLLLGKALEIMTDPALMNQLIQSMQLHTAQVV